MHQGRRVKWPTMYLNKTIPPVMVLVEVFTKWFKGGGDGCHRGC
jgi:hypothetical protein